MRKIIKITMIMMLALNFYKADTEKPNVYIKEDKETINQLRPIVLYERSGRTQITGYGPGWIRLYCEGFTDICFQIVKHDDGSLWAYIYLNNYIQQNPYLNHEDLGGGNYTIYIED
jgi:hypothetical protein